MSFRHQVLIGVAFAVGATLAHNHDLALQAQQPPAPVVTQLSQSCTLALTDASRLLHDAGVSTSTFNEYSNDLANGDTTDAANILRQLVRDEAVVGNDQPALQTDGYACEGQAT